MTEKSRATIELPAEIKGVIEGEVLTLAKDKVSIKKRFPFRSVHIKLEGQNLVIASKKETKREKTIIGTIKAHVRNMIKGLQEGHHYKLKVCSGHFPMTAAVNNGQFEVKNFLGEKKPRVLKLRDVVEVKVEGDMVTVECNDKDAAGQTAADIEKLCKITNRDPRIFQDGIWIVEKDGKHV